MAVLHKALMQRLQRVFRKKTGDFRNLQLPAEHLQN